MGETFESRSVCIFIYIYIHITVIESIPLSMLSHTLKSQCIVVKVLCDDREMSLQLSA